MIKLKNILTEKLTFEQYNSYRDDLIKAANELANHCEMIANGLEKNNQSKESIRTEMRKAEKYREMAKWTKRNF